MEPIGCSEGITTIRCVISQKSADLINFVAEALKRVSEVDGASHRVWQLWRIDKSVPFPVIDAWLFNL